MHVSCLYNCTYYMISIKTVFYIFLFAVLSQDTFYFSSKPEDMDVIEGSEVLLSATSRIATTSCSAGPTTTNLLSPPAGGSRRGATYTSSGSRGRRTRAFSPALQQTRPPDTLLLVRLLSTYNVSTRNTLMASYAFLFPQFFIEYSHPSIPFSYMYPSSL